MTLTGAPAAGALLEFDVTERTYETLKVQPVPNYDASLYETKRIDVTARDGQRVPVTLLWRPDATAGDKGGSACHLYGYGSYGICIDPSFSSTRLALVDRGVVFAIAHVRGGGEMGHNSWCVSRARTTLCRSFLRLPSLRPLFHHPLGACCCNQRVPCSRSRYEKQGKYLAKRNTFFDFVDCAKHLLDDGIAEPGALSCEGRSAGGLLVGNVVNDAPELFAACVAGVPFVDLMTTMCDPSIPLTTEEWEEWGTHAPGRRSQPPSTRWPSLGTIRSQCVLHTAHNVCCVGSGNPNEEKYHDYMMSYSPINNVRADAGRYPAMLIVSGLNDPRVAYWEPTKWAQVLRAKIPNGDDVLLKMDLTAGHFSASDRYKYLKELSFDYAFLLDQLALRDSPILKK